MFVIGVGPTIDVARMNQIAGGAQNTYRVNSYADLDLFSEDYKIFRRLYDDICVNFNPTGILVQFDF